MEALLIRPFGHPERSHPLANLAKALRYRYARSRDQMDLDRAVFLDREAQDLCSSHQYYHSLASKGRIVESQLLTLTVQSLNRYLFAIQTNNTNSIGQLKDIVLDKIGASESTLTSNDATHVTNADTGVRPLVDLKPNAQCTSAGGIFSITDSDHTSGDDDVINLVTPNVAHENAGKSDDGELLQVQVMKLLEMSFSSKVEITLALVAASRDLDRAIEYLLNGIPEKRKALAELYIALKGVVDTVGVSLVALQLALQLGHICL
ncbi:hypothetical protein FRB96_005725 [Tulasnella sp. 330]|nr:hypothetical protein FRB96_005725 [Tulasnella sp. 330]